MRYNWDTNRPQEEVELTDVGDVWFNLPHDLFFEPEIWTGAGKTGTELVMGTDFELQGPVTTTTVFGDAADVYRSVRILNNSYFAGTLFISVAFVADLISADDLITAPLHEWDGINLRLRNPDNSWGAWTALGEQATNVSLTDNGDGSADIVFTFDRGGALPAITTPNLRNSLNTIVSTDNGNGTLDLTFNFAFGSDTVTTPNLSNSITNFLVQDNGNGTLDLTLQQTYGVDQTITTPDLTGPAGDQGEAGIAAVWNIGNAPYVVDAIVSHNTKLWIALTATSEEPGVGAEWGELILSPDRNRKITFSTTEPDPASVEEDEIWIVY